MTYYKVEIYKFETPFITNDYTGNYRIGTRYVKTESEEEAIQKILNTFPSFLAEKLFFKIKQVERIVANYD